MFDPAMRGVGHRPNPIRWLVFAAAVAVNLVAWWSVNQLHVFVEWRDPLKCVSYWSPDDRTHIPGNTAEVPAASIERDLRRLAGRTKCVRIYHVQNGMQRVPDIAARYGLDVILGVWVTEDRALNRSQLDTAIELANSHDNVRSLIIGNETLQYDRLGLTNLVTYIEEAARRTETPVSTAETSTRWLEQPELAQAVDFITVHILPYWDGISRERAIPWVFERYRELELRYPQLDIVIGETGWPSSGPENAEAVPSRVNQARFVREFASQADAASLDYNIIEAFDQPWKIDSIEGRVGAHWGFLTPEGDEKYSFSGPVIADPDWPMWVLSSSGFALLIVAWFFVRYPRLGRAGVILAVFVSQLLATLATLLVVTADKEYLIGDPLIWLFVFPTTALVLAVIATLMIETAEVLGDAPLPLTTRALTPATPRRWPFVSIHVACRNEPAEMMKQTVASLLALDYPAFEIIVIDNNTPDEATWRPLEEYCRRFPGKVHFHVLKDWPGFKAGALNYGLTVTSPKAEIIAVIDADYIVDRDWLAATVPLFEDPLVAVVQAPQDHRDCEGSAFERMAGDEYSGFFKIGMVQRNEDNAIIQHGTMTLISRKALESAGRWAEWCIVEDAELGLRLHERGHKAVYVARSFGRGLVPTTFAGFSKQRFRWAYGAVRVTMRHWRQLLGLAPGLTGAQRFRYVAGWLPWFADAFHLLFSLIILVASVFFITDFRHFPPPEFGVPFILFTLLRWTFTLFTYRKRVAIGWGRTVAAAVVGVALTNTIASAVLRGIFSARLPFVRTDKSGQRFGGGLAWLRALGGVPLDMVLALGLFGAGVALLARYGVGSADAITWCIVLWLQAFPGLSAVALTLASSRRREPEPRDEHAAVPTTMPSEHLG